jgi:hypothetical protein
MADKNGVPFEDKTPPLTKVAVVFYENVLQPSQKKRENEKTKNSRIGADWACSRPIL